MTERSTDIPRAGACVFRGARMVKAGAAPRSGAWTAALVSSSLPRRLMWLRIAGVELINSAKKGAFSLQNRGFRPSAVCDWRVGWPV